MTTHRYLAMTAAEFSAADSLPPEPAWMACHFSPYATGLSNLPTSLPLGTLLILNDRTPIHGHDPDRIAVQLSECIRTHGCSGLLMDFQRIPCDETRTLAKALAQALPCPTVVSAAFAQDLDCPVFLPPCPLHSPLSQYIAPWTGREIWLELALDGEVISLTEAGASFSASETTQDWDCQFSDDHLHCRYAIRVSRECTLFLLKRTREDVDALCAEAEALGIRHFVGLYQELGENENRSA